MIHDHNHSHPMPPTGFEKKFLIGIILNTAFIVIEVIYGLIANALTLLADAAHNTSDVFSLFLAWIALLLSKRKPSARHTYGLRSFSILAALTNALVLVFACFAIAWNALHRFSHPEPVAGITVMIVAGIGVVINGITAWLFASGRKSDLNIEGVFLHMTADAIVSLSVVITGALILGTGWMWVDPTLSILISLIIFVTTWGLFKNSFNLALHGAPTHINTHDVKAYLASRHDVTNVHDLHVWAMSTNETALSVHLLMGNGHPGDAFLSDLAHELEHKFQINHSTIQIEIGDGAECKLTSDHTV